MTACYEKSGIRFLYPENWQITDEQVTDSAFSVSVQSPETAFWSLVVYRAGEELHDLLEQVLQSMRREYDGLESQQVVDRFGDVESLGYDMHFYCLDFIVSSRTMAIGAGGKTLLIMWQAEDREFERLEPVFRAITTSLLQAGRSG